MNVDILGTYALILTHCDGNTTALLTSRGKDHDLSATHLRALASACLAAAERIDPASGKQAAQDSEHHLALALRVEDAIKRLDDRLRDSEQWRDAVAEWRECVRQFAAGSMSAAGVLLGLVRLAWACPVDIEEYYTSTSEQLCIEVSLHYEERFSAVSGTLAEALTVALESAP